MHNPGTPKTISRPDFDVRPQPAPSENEVHLWTIHLAGIRCSESRWRSILSPDETARADRFHFVRDRQTFTATRALLRIVLASYAHCNPSALSFSYSETGKPRLRPMDGENGLQFNVSHSGDTALLACSRSREVGVDVEQIRTDVNCKTVANRFFSSAEQEALARLTNPELHRGFFRCWTRKESYLKARGTGLSSRLDSFDVSICPGDRKALLATRPDANEADLWSLCEVDVGEAYAAALSIRGQDWELKQ